jgi:hypothetical protein
MLFNSLEFAVYFPIVVAIYFLSPLRWRVAWLRPIWDYSNWPHSADTRYFTNSQHLNVEGPEQFSLDLAMNLKQYIDSHRLVPPSTLRAEGTPHRKNER